MEYFEHLNFYGFAKLFGLFLCWDIIGYFIFKKLIKDIGWMRLLVWIWGWGIFSLVYFIWHFWQPFVFWQISITFIFIVLTLFPFYLKNSGIRSLWSSVKSNWTKVLWILPVLFILFVKTSLPPYTWDEMTYHYMSPYMINQEKVWPFGKGGLYQEIPRLMETGYVGLFALFDTYQPARLVHALIFLSFVFAITEFLEKKSGKPVSRLALMLLIFWNISTQSTSGYIDVAAAVFISLGTITSLLAVLENKINLNMIPVSFGWWGLALSTKYNALLPFAISSLVLSIILFLKRKNLLLNTVFKKLVLGVLMVGLMGGYWYLKNQYYYSTPFFPFYPLGCPNRQCEDFLSSFKATWKGTSMNFSIIFLQIVKKINLPIGLILLTVSVFSGWTIWKSRYSSLFKIFLPLSLILFVDILISSRVFVLIFRYYFHWWFLLVICFGVFWGMTRFLGKRIVLLFLTLIVFTKLTTDNLQILAEPEFKVQLNFARSQLSVSEWIKYLLPKTHAVIEWCNNRNDVAEIMVSDPDLIWYSFEGRMSIFLKNCKYGGLRAKEGKMSGYLVSLSGCQNPKTITRGHVLEDDNAFNLRKKNNELVCKGKQITQSLYYIEYAE